MTTAQPMLAPRRRRLFGRTLAWVFLALMAPLSVGCSTSSGPEFAPVRTLQSPVYGATGEEFVWAVAPLRNESGVAQADVQMVADALVEQIEQVDGLACVPFNRTLAAMRALDLRFISTPEEAQALAGALGVDALVIGTVTSWNPYNPPKLGLALALFVAPGSPMATGAVAPTGPEGPPDPVLLQSSPTERGMPGSQWSERPASVVSEQLDGANHLVQKSVKEFAEGRSPTVSALGWRRYLASMPLYAEFACYRLTERLLAAEERRVAGRAGAEGR